VVTKRLLAVGAIVIGTAVLAACGDDGGDDASIDEAYCQARIDAEIAINAEDPEALNEALTAFEDNAPADLEDATTTFVDAAREDPAALFEDPEVQEAGMEISEAVYNDCGFEQVEVTGLDYSFEGIPEEVTSGDVAFQFTNDGEEPHEMLIVRINDDADMTIDEIIELPQREAQELVTSEAATFAEPGGTDWTMNNLEAGSYAALCFVETADGVPHVVEGMVYPFEVT